MALVGRHRARNHRASGRFQRVLPLLLTTPIDCFRFTNALAQVDDPELQRVIGRHRDDELRHERLFRERLAAQNAKYELPEHLRLVPRVDREAGGVIDKPIRDAHGVVEAYAFLQALEERAVFSFGLFIAAITPVDPGTARVMLEVLEDEKRHLKYCVAVSRRYAKDEAERLEVLGRMRAAEARAFRQNQLANMKHTLGKGWVGGPLETALWQLVRGLVLVIPFEPQAHQGAPESTLGSPLAA